MKTKSKNVIRLTGAAVVTTALLVTPSSPLFMKKDDPYRALRSPASLAQNSKALAQSLFSIEKARANGPDQLVPMNSLRAAVGFVLGYGSRDAYVKFACEGTDPGAGLECDGPPQEGIVGKMASILNTLPAALESAGVTSCESIPTSGTATATMAGTSTTLTFKTAGQLIPSHWDNGGTAFTKRVGFAVTVAGSAANFDAEFKCGVDGILMAVNMAVGDHAVGYNRPINVWVGKKGGLRMAEVYVAEVNSLNNVRGVYGYQLVVDEANTEYRLAGSAGSWFNTDWQKSGMDRVHIHGNYSTNEASVYMHRGIKTKLGTDFSYLDGDGFEALPGGDDSNVGTGTLTTLNTATVATAGLTFEFQGWVDFDSPENDPANTAICSGLALDDHSALAIDSSGNLGSGWLLKTMPSKLVNVPSI